MKNVGRVKTRVILRKSQHAGLDRPTHEIEMTFLKAVEEVF
jgi:hypothetical protein